MLCACARIEQGDEYDIVKHLLDKFVWDKLSVVQAFNGACYNKNEASATLLYKYWKGMDGPDPESDDSDIEDDALNGHSITSQYIRRWKPTKYEICRRVIEDVRDRAYYVMCVPDDFAASRCS